MMCSVTSSSRTAPSARVRRRIFRRAFPAFVPCNPSVRTGTASRSLPGRNTRLVDADAVAFDGGGQIAV